MNAKVILNEMVEHLIENDPKNEAKYKSNLDKALKDVDKLTIDVMTELSNSVSSIVFHEIRLKKHCYLIQSSHQLLVYRHLLKLYLNYFYI